MAAKKRLTPKQKRKGPVKTPTGGTKPVKAPKTPVNQRTAKQKANAKKFGNTAFGKKILAKKKK